LTEAPEAAAREEQVEPDQEGEDGESGEHAGAEMFPASMMPQIEWKFS
jgi:hypothetical protein